MRSFGWTERGHALDQRTDASTGTNAVSEARRERETDQREVSGRVSGERSEP